MPPALKSDSNQTEGLVPLVGDEKGEDEGKFFWGSVQSDWEEKKEKYPARTLFYNQACDLL